MNERRLPVTLVSILVGSLLSNWSDGGEPHRDLEAVLGRDRYERLVEELFHMHI